MIFSARPAVPGVTEYFVKFILELGVKTGARRRTDNLRGHS